MDIATLGIRVDSSQVRAASGDLRQLSGSGQVAAKSAASVARAVAGWAAAFAGAGAALSAVVRSSQEIVKITNGFRAMGMSAEQASRTLADVAGIAERTRAPLQATAELYRRVSVAGRDLGASQQDVKRFTENVGLALAASGTSASEASGALLQLSQEMAGGTVRAEEFNSILEGAFPIAQAAADGIDAAAGSVGRLRQLVVEGEISSEEFFNAIISQTDALEQAFAATTPTIGQAVTVLGDSFALMANEMDSALGISAAVSAGILLLADNLDVLRVGVLGTTAVVVGYYTPTIIAATVATARWVASLITLRGALMATGVGALIVGAGLMIDYLLRLRTATGSWGAALSALGGVAVGVWEQIKGTAASIPPSLQAVWESMKAGFLGALAAMGAAWASFLGSLAMSAREVPFFGDAMGDTIADAAMKAERAVDGLYTSSSQAAGAASALRSEAEAFASGGAAALDEALAELNATMNGTAGATADTASAADEAAAALAGMGDAAAGGGGGGAAGQMDEAKLSADKLAGTLANQVVDGAMSALDAFLDFAFRGFKDFKTFAQSILNVFTDMIKQMIMTAARNKIMLSVGMTASPTGSIAGTGGSLLSSGGSLLGGAGGLLGTLGTGLFSATPVFGTGLLGGLGSTLSATFGAGGGIGGLFSIGANSAAVGGGLMAGIGAALPVLGIAAGVGLLIFGFLNKKEKVISEGIEGIITMEDAIFKTYQKIETSRLFGLIKSTRTESKRISDRKAEPLVMAVTAVQDDVIASAEALGVSAGVFDGFSYKFKTSLKKMDDEAKQAAVEAEFENLGNAMAKMAFNSAAQFRRLREMGEGANDTLKRLADSLVSVNTMWDRLGFEMFNVSILGGAAASSIVELYGSLDDFNALTSSYYQNFYSEQERYAQAIKELGADMMELGIEAVPASRDAFRALVDAAYAMGDDALVAGLIKLSPLMAEITQSSDDLVRSLDASKFATKAAFEFTASQIARGNMTDSYSERQVTDDLLRDLIRAVREGNHYIIQNTADTARELTRQNLEPVVS